jgi:hypothetical protein
VECRKARDNLYVCIEGKKRQINGKSTANQRQINGKSTVKAGKKNESKEQRSNDTKVGRKSNARAQLIRLKPWR